LAWAIVSGATSIGSAGSGTGSPWSAGALGASVSVGHRVIVATGYNAASGSPAVSAISDGLGNTYRKEGSLSFTAGAPQELAIWSAPVTTGGTPSFSVTFSGGGGGFGLGLAAAAFSGLSTASDGSEVDVAAKITSAASSSGTTVGSTTAANELAVGFYTDWGNTGGNVTVGAGYTLAIRQSPDGNCQILLEYKDSGASASTVSSSVTGNEAQDAVGVIVFGLASGGGGFDPSTVPWQMQAPEVPTLAVIGF
jgi:hypothetical protein